MKIKTLMLCLIYVLIHSCKTDREGIIIRCSSNFKEGKVVHFELTSSDISAVDTLNYSLTVNEKGVQKIGNTAGTLKEYIEILFDEKLIGYININCNFSSNKAEYFVGYPYIVCDHQTKSILTKDRRIQLNFSNENELKNARIIFKNMNNIPMK